MADHCAKAMLDLNVFLDGRLNRIVVLCCAFAMTEGEHGTVRRTFEEARVSWLLYPVLCPI